MNTLAVRNRGGLRPWLAPWDLPEEFSRVFGELSNGFGFARDGFTPALDVRETDEGYLIEADIPGIGKEDLDIEVADNVVSISGERKTEHEEDRKDYHRVERQFGSFRRTVTIPGGFNHSAVEAKFDDGVLRVTLPKLEEAKPRRIKVKAK